MADKIQKQGKKKLGIKKQIYTGNHDSGYMCLKKSIG